MKTGLLCAIVVAVLLLSSLLYWKPRPAEGAAPGSPPRTEAPAPESRVVLSGEAAPPKEAARSAGVPATPAPPGLAGDLASSSAAAVVPASTPETWDPGDEVFEAKYMGMDSEARRQALESLRSMLEGKREGGAAQGPVLTDKQIQQSKLEIEWLVQHPG